MNDTGDSLQTKDGIETTVTEANKEVANTEQVKKEEVKVIEKEVTEKEGKDKEKEGKNRSVSFNRDVHVKRFGEFTANHTLVLSSGYYL